MTARQRLAILDSNVWRYVADAGAELALIRAARSSPLRIAVAPAVLYEALRMRDADLRRRLARLMTEPGWERLMPEAYLEAMDVLDEMRCHRPGWLRQPPDQSRFNRFRYDWVRRRGGFWERARIATDKESRDLALLDNNLMDRARDEARATRQTLQQDGWHYHSIRLSDVRAGWSDAAPGWDGRQVAAWRAAAVDSTRTNWLRAGASRDWLEPFIDFHHIQYPDASWYQFWLDDVRETTLPREWLRWAVPFLQGMRKVTDGTPGDAQLAIYLVDADLLVTADRAFAEIVDRVREEAPFPLAQTLLLPAGTDGVNMLLMHLSSEGILSRRSLQLHHLGTD
ncbi:MAG: hypothetical protein AB7P21_30305 [Lautropia sp.]